MARGLTVDPIREAESNIATVTRLLRLCDQLHDNAALLAAIERQDAVASQQIVNDIICRAVRRR